MVRVRNVPVRGSSRVPNKDIGPVLIPTKTVPPAARVANKVDSFNRRRVNAMTRRTPPQGGDENRTRKKVRFKYYTKYGIEQTGKLKKPYKFYGFIQHKTVGKYKDNAYNRRIGRAGQSKKRYILSRLANKGRKIIVV